MTDFLMTLLKSLAAYLPFLLLLWLDSKANLKRKNRSGQFLLPLFALVYSVVLMLLANELGTKVTALLLALPTLLEGIPFLSALAPTVERLINAVRIELLLFYTLNVLLLAAHVLLKTLCLPLLKLLCGALGDLADEARGLCYEQESVSGEWVLKRNCAQGRTFLKTMFLAGVLISLVVGRIALALYFDHRLSALFYPVFGVIVLGELYFFVNGLSARELAEDIASEDERPTRYCNYVPLRAVLRKLFPDKLAAENTTMGTSILEKQENGSGLSEHMKAGDAVADAYYAYMYRQQRDGLKLDSGYLASGLNLARGKSVLFNDPFYYDLIPYAFYAMNRNLLRHRKVLVILGRHGVEDDVSLWVERGLSAVTNIPQMWSIGVLTDREQELDVGIVTRSGVHELDLHAQNEDFFLDVGMVVLVEPSRLLTTAQVGLNSIIRRCGREDVTYCSTDRNCDGLVDALSHLLMTDITEVSATNRHEGTCSYMCWETDGDNLQHRLLPNISRYLGVGTELSFAALKNQVEKAVWYGGEAFPVKDMHWIARQYYYDLLHYAGLTPNQDEMDRCFVVSHNTWNESVQDNGYFVVEDENCNMFEIKREFATRATEQSFINIISPQYLLHDYMAENEGLFNTDPKAIPTLVADYAATQRNVTLRLLLRMSLGDITRRELADELQMIGIGGDDPVAQFWLLLCRLGSCEEDDRGEVSFLIVRGEERYTFRREETIETVRKYCVRTGEIDDFVRLIDTTFRELMLGDLKNARYVSEEENGEQKYLGSELVGHIFQRYLPGQFFTFEGKYYEMLRMTPDGRVVLRRAAEHITGRQYYRQIRTYRIRNAETVDEMGSCRSVGGMRVTRQVADLSVETSGYWQMRGYQDFAGGKKIALNGIPTRSYGRKQILCVEFNTDGEPLDDKLCQTLALLINETFRTLFAGSSEYIAALSVGEFEQPMTYSLLGEGGFEPKRGCIYFVEDSQVDLGLLIAVERNLQRVLEIVCDYLDWHFEALRKSQEEPASTTADGGEEPAGTEEESPAPEKKKRKGIFARIRDWFRKLFGKKKKDAPADGEPADGTANDAPADGEPADGTADGTPAAGEPADDAANDAPTEGEPADGMENDIPADGEPADSAESDTPVDEAPANDEAEGTLVGCSLNAPRAEKNADAIDDAAEDAREGDTFEFEKPESVKVAPLPTRRPYHERCYTYYGASETPECLDLAGVLSFLLEAGFGGRELSQARKGKDTAALIAQGYQPDKAGVHYCDFCGAELTGTEYDVLSDGRESCTACSRTAVRTEEEFREIYHEVIKNMEIFYGIRFTAPVKVRMVNARRLQKAWSKRPFVPTSGFDARAIGLAISDAKGYTLLVENGAPRLRTTMTMAHELTHIWQYLNWNRGELKKKYGDQLGELYEGMATWSEIQYAYLIGEAGTAKRFEIINRHRDDEYGRGFVRFAQKYPLSEKTHLEGLTPFDGGKDPL